jgi:hypothetical protein
MLHNSLTEYDVSYAEGKYNMKILTTAFTKVNSISIHQLISYMSYKRCHMTFLQVAEHNPPIKNKRGMGVLISRHGLHPRSQAIKLLVSLTYPLKITKGQPRSHPTTPQPTPHRHPTQSRAQRLLRVRVAPRATMPEPATQVRQSLLPSPRAQDQAAHWRARGV